VDPGRAELHGNAPGPIGVDAATEAIARLDKAISDALRAPDIVARVHNGGMRVTYLNPSDFRKHIGAESAMFGTIIKKGDIKLP
jgi:tripartite-type tricarboxylate transporter receptor subunit TctC